MECLELPPPESSVHQAEDANVGEGVGGAGERKQPGPPLGWSSRIRAMSTFFSICLSSLLREGFNNKLKLREKEIVAGGKTARLTPPGDLQFSSS